MRKLFLIAGLLSLCTLSEARPIFTEPAGTIGRNTFEAAAAVSQRVDKFGSPEQTYDTIYFPLRFRFGVHQRVDLGLTLDYVGQRLKKENLKLNGSNSGRLSPEIKIALLENVSLWGVWGLASGEDDQEFPIARGGDVEGHVLVTVPTEWPVHINTGYIHRGHYNSRQGISGGPVNHVEPGDVWQSRLALEIPLPYHLSLLSEWAYYQIQSESINDHLVGGTKGSAADSYVGLSWEKGGLSLGGGVGFGLLKESHTSFAVDRGAGDVMGKFFLAYQLRPKKSSS